MQVQRILVLSLFLATFAGFAGAEDLQQTPAPQAAPGFVLDPFVPPPPQDVPPAPDGGQAAQAAPAPPLATSPLTPAFSPALTPPGGGGDAVDAPQVAAAAPKTEDTALNPPALQTSVTSAVPPEPVEDDSQSPLPPQWVLDAIASQAAADAQSDAAQNPVVPQGTQELQYPRVVLFSTSWCPHCKMAKEYLVRNNIPFINRDVDEDREALNLLMDKYKSQSVPFFVFGEDAEVMNGFTEERFQNAVERAKKKK